MEFLCVAIVKHGIFRRAAGITKIPPEPVPAPVTQTVDAAVHLAPTL